MRPNKSEKEVRLGGDVYLHVPFTIWMGEEVHDAQCDGLGNRCLNPLFNVVMTATSITQTRNCSRGQQDIGWGGGGCRDFHSSFNSFLDSVNHCL